MSNFREDFLNGCAKFVQRVLPHPCVLCGGKAGAQPLCPGCRTDLPWATGARCPRCALPTTNGALCGQCLAHPPSFDRTVAALDYRFPVDALIQAFKYGHRLALSRVLGDLLADAAANAARPDLLIPMPLHAKRLRERGFNQANELARRLARELTLTVDDRGARRVRATVPQVALPWKERAANLRGAFVCERRFDGLHVALVDDVMTTGSSLNELAKVVRRHGAREISAWVLARTPDDQPALHAPFGLERAHPAQRHPESGDESRPPS